MQRALKPTPRRRSGGPPGHGQNIYAYCNVRTRQVLYSLSRSLDSHQSLRQLPDLGPNTVPPKLRKDVWKPLYTLALPPAASPSTLDPKPPSYNTHAQGLDAFRKLREYRKLHETNWTPPEELSRLYSKDEIKALEKKYDERGGSKKESVYDIIKREKKKLRRVIVMDQKANSIADLAAVLIQQERNGQEREAEQREEREAERLREVQEMLRYAEIVERSGFKGIDSQISQYEDLVKMSPEELEAKRNEAEKKGGNVPKSKRLAKDMLYGLIRKKKRMEFAATAVKKVHKRMAASRTILKDLRTDRPAQDTSAQPAEAVSTEQPQGEIPSDQEGAKTIRGVVEVTEKHHSEREEPSSVQRGDLGAPSHAVKVTEEPLQAHKRKLAMETAREVDGKSSEELQARFDALEAQLNEFTGKLQLLEESDAQEKNEDQIESVSKEVESVTVRLEVVGHALMAIGIEPRNYGLIVDNDAEVEDPEESVGIGENTTVTNEAAKMETTASSDKETRANSEEATALDSNGLPNWHSLLPSFPTGNTDPWSLSKHDKNRHRLLRLSEPVFSMEGVKVQWANILDAEFAEAWPATVQHEHMGMVRHTAKPPSYKAKMTVLDANKHLIERAVAQGEIPPDEVDEAEGSAQLDAEAAAEAKKAARRAAEEDALARRKALVQQLTDEVVSKLKEPRLPRVRTPQHLLARKMSERRAKKRAWGRQDAAKKAQRQAAADA